jgi:hypothetical protein
MEVNKELIKNTYDYYRYKLKHNIINSGNPEENINIFNPNIIGLVDSMNVRTNDITIPFSGNLNELNLYYDNGAQINDVDAVNTGDELFFDINGSKKYIISDDFELRYQYLQKFFTLDYQDNLENYEVIYQDPKDNILEDHILNNRFKNFRFFEREIKPTYGKRVRPFIFFDSSERNKFFDFINEDNNMVSILTATTGSGKTTEIPLYLLEFGFSKFNLDQKILVTQPRRVAASNPASYVSKLTDMPRKIIFDDFEFNMKRIRMTKTYAFFLNNLYYFLHKKNKYNFDNTTDIIKFDSDLKNNNDYNLISKIKKNESNLVNSAGLGITYNYLVGGEKSLIIFTHPTENIYEVIESNYYLQQYECFLKKDLNLINNNNEKFLIRKLKQDVVQDTNISYGFINKNLYYKYNNDELNYYVLKNYWDNYNKNQGVITFLVEDKRIIQSLNNDEVNFKIDRDYGFKIGSLSNGFCYYKNDKRKKFYLLQNSFFTNIQIEYESDKVTTDAEINQITNQLKENYNSYSGEDQDFEPNIYLGSSYIKLPLLPNISNDDLFNNNSAYNYNNFNADLTREMNKRFNIGNPFKVVPVDSNIIFINERNQVVEPYNNLDKKVQNELTRIKIKYSNNSILQSLKLSYDNNINKGLFNLYQEEENLKQAIYIYKVDGVYFVLDNNKNKLEFELFLKLKTRTKDILLSKTLDLGGFKISFENNDGFIKDEDIHRNLLPFVRVYENGTYKFKYSKIHRLSNNFKPDIKIIDNNNFEIKYYVQFINEEFSVFNRNNVHNLGFTIVDKYRYSTELEHFILIERVNNNKQSFTAGTFDNKKTEYKDYYDNLIGDNIDLYLTINLKRNNNNELPYLDNYEITIFKESIKRLFDISTISIDNNFVKNNEFIDNSKNKLSQLEEDILLKLVKYLEIKDIKNKSKQTILEEIFSNPKLNNLKNILVVLDKNFRLKTFKQDTTGNRNLSLYELKLLEKGTTTEFDFYSELIQINNIINSHNYISSDLEKFNIDNIINNLNKNYVDNLVSTCIFHKINSLNFDIKNQKTIPINISSMIGCKYKGNNQINSNTVIDFITDGTFEVEIYRELMNNDNYFLDKYSCVLIDEAHERTIPTELIMSLFQNKLLPNIKKRGREFKLLIMSATINKSLFLDYFNTNYYYHIDGSTKDINIWYHNYKNKKLFEIIKTIIGDIISKKYMTYDLEVKGFPNRKVPVAVKKNGGILIFMPTIPLIKSLGEELEKIYSNYKILFLWRDNVDLDNIVNEPTSFWSKEDNKNYEGRIIISTDVAETSITPKDITDVIDSGYVLKNFYNPIKKIENVTIIPTSINSMVQRMGRVGRNMNGNFFPVFTKKFYSFTKDDTNSLLKKSLPPPIVNMNIKEKIYKLFILNIISSPNEIISKYKMINKPNFEILKTIVEELKSENLIINKNNFNNDSNIYSNLIKLNKSINSDKVLNFIFENKNFYPYLREVLIMIHYLDNESNIVKKYTVMSQKYDILSELVLFYHINFKLLLVHNVRETDILNQKSIFYILQNKVESSSGLKSYKEFQKLNNILKEDLKSIEEYLKLSNLNNLFYIPELFSQQKKEINNDDFIMNIQSCIINGYNNLFVKVGNDNKYKSLESEIVVSLEKVFSDIIKINNSTFIPPNYVHISNVTQDKNNNFVVYNNSIVIFYFDKVVEEYLKNKI